MVIFVIIIIKMTIIISIATIIIIIGIFSIIRVKHRFLRPQNRYKLPERRRGEAMPEGKHLFLKGGFPLLTFVETQDSVQTGAIYFC